MPGRFFTSPRRPASPGDRTVPAAGRRVRLPLLGRAQVALLAALVYALVVVTSEPVPQARVAPTWATPIGHAGTIRPLDPAAVGEIIDSGEGLVLRAAEPASAHVRPAATLRAAGSGH